MKDLKKGDKVLIHTVLEEWFDDGTDMHVYYPAVIEEVVANIGAKCSYYVCGEILEKFFHWGDIKQWKGIIVPKARRHGKQI